MLLSLPHLPGQLLSQSSADSNGLEYYGSGGRRQTWCYCRTLEQLVFKPFQNCDGLSLLGSFKPKAYSNHQKCQTPPIWYSIQTSKHSKYVERFQSLFEPRTEYYSGKKTQSILKLQLCLWLSCIPTKTEHLYSQQNP